ncbi:deoxyribonuclease TATDN1-like [Macrosteles quadrilineatus]|uniref:deoxyribonuclease TATDN1-like n=1 Tax=Macrosteles quadrilineatus TaxID=74068 RepID=UPI0023E330AB|nr:deoxyribonuclease TATDN1-like [Macrosteles quadrilineatus]
MESENKRRRFFDAAAYLTTPTYKGVYDGIKEHDPDLTSVFARSWRRCVNGILIPGINASVSREALEIAKTDERVFVTVGCSPARSHEFDKEGAQEYMRNLLNLIENNRDKVLAFGEMGLDYRWLEICDKDTQAKYFEMQLEEAKNMNIPVYINSRNSVSDTMKILKNYEGKFSGLIHSFDGTKDEAKQFLDLGYYIGINGCSLRTEETLAMVKSIPLDKLILESNAPWCLMKPLHAGYRYVRTTYPARAKFHWSPDSMVRGRNEPSNINQVLEVVAAVKEESPDDICDKLFKNAQDLFFGGSQDDPPFDSGMPKPMNDDGEQDFGSEEF